MQVKKKWWLVGIGILSGVLMVGEVGAKKYEIELTFGEALPYQTLGGYSQSNFFSEDGNNEEKPVTTEAISLPKTRLELIRVSGTEKVWRAEGKILASTNNPSGYTLQLAKPKSDWQNEEAVAPTKCDDLQQPCTSEKAEVWVNWEREGAGYRVKGADQTSDWLSGEYFRPLADLEKGEAPAIVAHDFQPKTVDENLDLTYQINLSDKITSGVLETQIEVYLVPNL